MKALVETMQAVESGFRVAQVEQDENIFPVAEGLFWVDCPEDCVADRFWYNPEDGSLNAIPETVLPLEQATVVGAQTL